MEMDTHTHLIFSHMTQQDSEYQLINLFHSQHCQILGSNDDGATRDGSKLPFTALIANSKLQRIAASIILMKLKNCPENTENAVFRAKTALSGGLANFFWHALKQSGSSTSLEISSLSLHWLASYECQYKQANIERIQSLI